MKILISLFFLMAFALLITGCSASQETTEKEKEDEAEVFVFDEVPENETKTPEVKTTVPDPQPPYFIVQIGAFTTKDKADYFAAESKEITNNEIEVKFSSSVNLYVVQVKPYFKTRAEAESVRNKLWSTEGYQDAWIITVQ
jgi:cell division protein FtsN